MLAGLQQEGRGPRGVAGRVGRVIKRRLNQKVDLPTEDVAGRGHGEMNNNTTQLLTGHGAFVPMLVEAHSCSEWQEDTGGARVLAVPTNKGAQGQAGASGEIQPTGEQGNRGRSLFDSQEP